MTRNEFSKFSMCSNSNNNLSETAQVKLVTKVTRSFHLGDLIVSPRWLTRVTLVKRLTLPDKNTLYTYILQLIKHSYLLWFNDLSKLHSIAIVVLFYLLGTQPVMSESVADIRFRNIQTQNGLSNNDVNCIFKDSHGFMWIGTASGLNRYDGYGVRIYHSQRPDTTALRDNYVQDIQEDANGNLWIFAGDTYTVYNPATGKFHWLTLHEAQQIGLPIEPQHVMIHDNETWFVVNQNVLYKSGKGKKAVKVCDIKTSHPITCMIPLPTAKDNLAVITDVGELFVINRNGKCVFKTMVPHAQTNYIDFSLFSDNSGQIWVYSVLGVECLNVQTKEWMPRKICQELKGVSVKSVAQDDAGKIWIGTDNYGIYIADTDDNIGRLTNMASDMYSLPNNTVKTLYNPGDGGMWVGTYKKGVSIYYPSEYKFLSHPVADVNCIARNPNEFSSVWVGTDHSGLIKYNYSTHETVRIEDARDKGHYAITSMLADSRGDLWIGTYKGGLKRYSGGTFEHWNMGNGLSSDNIWAILEGNDGKIWLGTLDGGLQIYNPATKTFKTLNISNSKINSNYINTLAKGHDGMIYAGTTAGIVRISPSDYSITTYTGSYRDEKNFSNLNINQIAVDRNGLIWVGTREGLEVYDVKNDTLYNISLSERFPNPFILGITEGMDHSMWITVGNELFNISVASEPQSHKYSFHVTSYGHHDGTVSGTFNQRSMCLLPSGILLAGSIEGIVTVNPEKIALNTRKPHVIFTGLAIKNVPVEVGREYKGKVVLSGALDYIDKIRLDYNQNDLTVYFATDNYANPEHTTYKYRLEGFDNEWVTCAQGMHHATYTNLPPGKYTLHVVAINSDGFESSEASTIKIEISAPWWWTWWAKLLYFIAAVLSVFGISMYYHLRSVSKLREHQQQELARKTEELNQLKFKFFTNISHELRTPLTLILSPVESMLKDNPEERNARRLNTIKTNANRLLYLVNQLLDFRKNEMVGLTLHLSEGNIIGSIKSACDSFRELTDRKDIDFRFETDYDEFETSYDSDKFTKIILNLLSNAVKYTPDGGRIAVRFTANDGNVRISVADTGKGISDEDKRHIFERFYRGTDKSDQNTGTGIGLSLVYEYAKLHGGRVEVADNEPKGTVFTVVLPTSEAKPPCPPVGGPTNAYPTLTPSTGGQGGLPSVLFVDDNRDLTEFLKEEFSDAYSVSVAANGVEALRAIEKHSFDIIVTDLMMPEMDGIELSRHLKSNSATVDIPLIMLTAKQDMGSIIEGLTLGADDYITKPFNNEILSLKMQRLIGLKRKGLKRTLIDPTPSKIEITSLDEQLIAKAVKYVEDNIGRSDLSVEELAQNMGMSRVHLYKKITTLTGKSPIEFIRLLRLKRATQYLTESQLTIAEIAYTLGFNNPKYFSRYFKEEFGILPSEYQANGQS